MSLYDDTVRAADSLAPLGLPREAEVEILTAHIREQATIRAQTREEGFCATVIDGLREQGYTVTPPGEDA